MSLNRWAVELLLVGRQTLLILFKIVIAYTNIIKLTISCKKIKKQPTRLILTQLKFMVGRQNFFIEIWWAARLVMLRTTRIVSRKRPILSHICAKSLIKRTEYKEGRLYSKGRVRHKSHHHSILFTITYHPTLSWRSNVLRVTLTHVVLLLLLRVVKEAGTRRS